METVMTLGKYAAGLGAIASLLCSTAAVAADATRSSGALPVATGQPAPIQGIRAATPLKKQSNAISQNAGIVLGIAAGRSEEHTSELQSLMRNSYAVFCLKKKQKKKTTI